MFFILLGMQCVLPLECNKHCKLNFNYFNVLVGEMIPKNKGWEGEIPTSFCPTFILGTIVA